MLASFVHSLPFNIDVLSCPEGVETAQYMVAWNLHVTHWKEQTRTVILVHQPQRSTSGTQQGSANRKHDGFTQEPKISLSFFLTKRAPLFSNASCWAGRENKRKMPSIVPSQVFHGTPDTDHRVSQGKESFDQWVLPFFFFPPIEGDCNQILSKARFPFFWKEECKESEAWVSFLFLFQGRRVQSPYLFQDRAKYLMSTCPSFSDRCFSKGNSPVLWFCHVSQGEGIFCLDAQNLMGRLHASINVWNSQ